MKPKGTKDMNIKGLFDEEYEGFCYQNCIRMILKYYRVSSYNFYINMSLSTKMTIYDGAYKISYDKGAYGIIPSCRDKVLRQDDGRSTDDILKENLQYIKDGYPIINCVDGYYLDYFPYYEKKHCRHNLILTGESLQKDYVTVLDWYTPHFYQGKVNKKNYFAARSSENPYDGSIYSGSAIRNNWAIILREDWDKSVLELVAELVELSLEQYYFAESQIDCKYGVEVYRTLAKELEDIYHKEVMERKEALKYMHQELYGTVKRKKFFLYFLTLIIQMNLFQESIKNAYENMKGLVNCWERYLTMLLKVSFRGKESEITILENMLKDIIVYEEKFCDCLMKMKREI